MNQPQPTTNKDRCELCSYFHTSERCPNINAKRDPKWGEWDKSLKARPLAIFNGGKEKHHNKLPKASKPKLGGKDS